MEEEKSNKNFFKQKQKKIELFQKFTKRKLTIGEGSLQVQLVSSFTSVGSTDSLPTNKSFFSFCQIHSCCYTGDQPDSDPSTNGECIFF